MPTAYAGTNTYPATFDIPADTDQRNAASVGVGLEALGDRTAYLKARLGAEWIAEVDADEEKALSTLATSVAAAYPGATPNAASYTLPMLTDIQAGDVIEISGMVHLANSVAGTTVYVRPSMISQPSATVVTGAECIMPNADDPRPTVVFARLTVPAGADTWVVPWLEVKTGTAGNGASIASPSSVVVRAYRSTP